MVGTDSQEEPVAKSSITYHGCKKRKLKSYAKKTTTCEEKEKVYEDEK